MKPYDIKMQAWEPLGHGNKELFENHIKENFDIFDFSLDNDDLSKFVL